MPKIGILENYSKLEKKTRYVSSNFRNKIEHKIIAGIKGKEFYDGNRNYGYGGYKYDGRWLKTAKKLIKIYNITDHSSFLHVNCDKGYLLYEMKKLLPNLKIRGLERSKYAISKSKKEIRNYIQLGQGPFLKFRNREFDFIYAAGYVYEFALYQSIQALKELMRVSKNKKCFITLGAFKSKKDYELFKQWSLLGSTILNTKDWIKVLKFANYRGDYEFATAQTLGLKRK